MKKGFTLIEGIIVVFVFALVALAIMTAYVGVYKSIDLAKAKINAVALANEKMEIIRNMPYNNIGTVEGTYPPGQIPDNETVTRLNKNFNVHTVVSYVDDPYDDLSPADIYPYDYKKVEITVTLPTTSVIIARLTTNISAKAAETPTNTGIINICVIDSTGAPVEGATVTVTNSEFNPPVNITNLLTGIDGCVMVPMLPPNAHNFYHLTATKDGYSADLTYPRTSQNPNEPQPDVDVQSQQVTDQTLVIDHLSNLTLHFSNPVSFTLQGSKRMYFNPPTYKYSQVLTTDGSGNITINNIEFDNYQIISPSAPYFVVTTSPLRSVLNTDNNWCFPLNPGANLTVQVGLATTGSNPGIYNYAPLSGTVNTTINITVDGSNISNNASIKLHKTIMVTVGSTQVPQDIEIAGTNVSVNQNQISANFNLTTPELGNWDLIVTNPNGESVNQTNGFQITN